MTEPAAAVSDTPAALKVGDVTDVRYHEDDVVAEITNVMVRPEQRGTRYEFYAVLTIRLKNSSMPDHPLIGAQLLRQAARRFGDPREWVGKTIVGAGRWNERWVVLGLTSVKYVGSPNGWRYKR